MTRFRALKHRNFQLFIAGQLVSLIGTWMQTTAQLWLVYDLTHSPALLGIFGFANQIPMLVLASVGGYVGDRYSRHRGVIATQTISMVLAFILAGLTLTHHIHEWSLIAISFLVGIVNAFDVPIRQAFFVEMVGKEDLPNAIALNSSIFNGARVVGPAFAGFSIAGAGLGIADERGRSRSGSRRPAVCGAHDLQGPCEMDCGDVRHLRLRTDCVFTVARFLVIRRGSVRGGICGNISNGCNQHDRAKSRTG